MCQVMNLSFKIVFQVEFKLRTCRRLLKIASRFHQTFLELRNSWSSTFFDYKFVLLQVCSPSCHVDVSNPSLKLDFQVENTFVMRDLGRLRHVDQFLHLSN
eukprot:TRINITY_DN876_c1_g1_i6.p1 TRINITY_DN876_c1_g1~~TRINITY_DN876_c1_g1_i6.p1  ORF type:complete len:101 (+),score=23.01 TRINITY_DN876_c1_g1_i6:374-676(+)